MKSYQPLSLWRRIAVLLAVVKLCLPGFAYGKTVKDPLADYVTSEGFVDEVKFARIERISRVDLDLNRDGKKVVFLASSYVRHGGFAWTAYVPGKHGYTVGLPSQIENEMLCFTDDHSYVGYVREIKHRGIVFFQGRIADGFAFIAFWVSGGKARIKRIGGVAGRDDEYTAEKPHSLFKKYFPHLSEVEPPSPFKIETISIDDLRARGYVIPKRDP